MKNDEAKLKFTLFKVKTNDTFLEYKLEEFHEGMDKENIYCPDCEKARLTFVHAVTPFFRTRKGSLHSDICGKAVASTIKTLVGVNDSSIENLINRVLSRKGGNGGFVN
jgi:hypothetical protein